MHRDLEARLIGLLVRWHRWTESPTPVDDSLLRAFDAVMGRVPPKLRTALVFHARNMASGAQVWGTVRQQAELGEAKAFLQNLLGDDERRWFGSRVIHLNARGNRIGESNPRAELSDHEVDLLLEMRAETKEDGSPRYSYGWLAEKFEVPKSTVQSWCTGLRRGQVPARVKKV